MTNTENPSSTSARAVARQTETYDTSVFEARTTRIRCGAENLAIGSPSLVADGRSAAYRPSIASEPKVFSMVASADVT
jgi:hypothetical protein